MNYKNLLLWFLLVFLLSACSNTPTSTDVETLTLTSPAASPTPDAPTMTPVPAAALVNGERVPLAWFENEVSRYILAYNEMGDVIEDEAVAEEIVLNDLIDQVLLAQGAREAGAVVNDEDVQARIDTLAEAHDLSAWMAAWGYMDEELFQILKLQMLASYQRDEITESVPEEAEQVELQQIFTYAEADAQTALLSLNSGTPFDELASSYTYDPVTGGYLGWIPRGYLLEPAVEEAAFSLPVGSYSDVIESEVGYHIIMVIAREERPLTTDARMTLQRNVLHAWLTQQRENSTIEVLIQ
jgi:parvulin-like peptidyl-prolyl isomerase